jgi:hypothetical protein
MRHRIAAIALGSIVAGAAHALGPVPPSLTDSNASEPADEDLQASAQGHGSISIAYLQTYVNGLRVNQDTVLPNGAVHSRGVALDLDYFVADAWSLHVGLPYIDNRYQGRVPHCPTTSPPQCAGIAPLNPQHPESEFLDDGAYHGTWQDWTLGAEWHGQIGDYFITPSITAIVPSHDYTYFANAAVGQRLHQLLLAATLAHQFAFTNIYYKLGFGYAFSQRVLGHDTGYSRYDVELGWFVNEKFSLRTFVEGRLGRGLAAADLIPLTGPPGEFQTNDYWYRHDQLSEHSYFGAGLGFDYMLDDRNTLSAGIQRAFWGETVFDFKYAYEVRLTRSF